MFSIFLIVGLAVMMGIGLAVFATRQPVPGRASLVPPEDDAEKEERGGRAVTTEDLFRLGEKLCAENKLTVKEKMKTDERETLWIAESHNEFFLGNYVLGFYTVDDKNPYITLAELLEFKDFVKSMSSTKGLFFTSGYFTRDVHQMLEGPKVTLYNKRKVLEELKKHHLL